MKITIITPTVLRESLKTCCASVTQQTFTDWQHIVIADVPQDEYVANNLIANDWKELQDERRLMLCTPRPFRNGGNTPRHLAWQWAQGEFCYYLDDDNQLATPDALERLAGAIKGIEEKWAIFPIHRHGFRFFFDPPQPCHFDTGNAIARREIAQWPDIPDYASDAVWLEGLKMEGPYKAFPEMFPIMLMKGTSFGAGGGINGE